MDENEFEQNFDTVMGSGRCTDGFRSMAGNGSSGCGDGLTWAFCGG